MPSSGLRPPSPILTDGRKPQPHPPSPVPGLDPGMGEGPDRGMRARVRESAIDFIPSSCYPFNRSPLDGVLLMTVSVGLGWMAGPRVWGDVPHIPGGGWTDPGTLRPPRRKAVGLLSFEATAEELSTQRRSPAGITGAARRLSPALKSWHTAPGSARASLTIPRETSSPWGTNATPAKVDACPLRPHIQITESCVETSCAPSLPSSSSP